MTAVVLNWHEDAFFPFGLPSPCYEVGGIVDGPEHDAISFVQRVEREVGPARRVVLVGALRGRVAAAADGGPNPNAGIPDDVVRGAVAASATEFLAARLGGASP